MSEMSLLVFVFLFYIFVLNSIEIKHFSLMIMSNKGFKSNPRVYLPLAQHPQEQVFVMFGLSLRCKVVPFFTFLTEILLKQG